MAWGPSPLRVLIAEDDRLIAWGLVTLLEAAGHHVCSIARDAESTVRLAEQEHPDVVLLDIRLASGACSIAAAQEIR